MPKAPKAPQPPDADAAQQETAPRRPLRYLREEGLFRCAICSALVCHAPAGDVSPTLGEVHICAT